MATIAVIITTMGGRRPFRGGPAEDGAVVAETEVAQVKRGPKFTNRIENFAYTWEKLLDLSDWHRFILFHGYQVDFQDTPPRRRCLNLNSAQCCENQQFQVIICSFLNFFIFYKVFPFTQGFNTIPHIQF